MNEISIEFKSQKLLPILKACLQFTSKGLDYSFKEYTRVEIKKEKLVFIACSGEYVCKYELEYFNEDDNFQEDILFLTEKNIRELIKGLKEDNFDLEITLSDSVVKLCSLQKSILNIAMLDNQKPNYPNIDKLLDDNKKDIEDKTMLDITLGVDILQKLVNIAKTDKGSFGITLKSLATIKENRITTTSLVYCNVLTTSTDSIKASDLVVMPIKRDES